LSSFSGDVYEPLSHFDRHGQAQMVDVTAKAETHRHAPPPAPSRCARRPWRLIVAGSASKGDVLAVARIAAIQGAKRTSDLIPLCHPIALTRITVEFEIDCAASSIACKARVESFGRTGVEMEALSAVSIGLLTIYDMCKAADRGMRLEGVRLLEKDGGRSGHWQGD
jgi:cyclic pyranopterin phosphate synthase